MKRTRGLYQRGGRWHFQCFIRGRRIRRVAGTTMREAERALAAFKSKAAKRKDPFAAERITFAELAREYLEKYSRPMKSASSARTDEGLLLHHLVPHFGDHRIGEVDKGALYEYRAERQKETVLGRSRPVSAATLNRETSLLRAMLSFAVEIEWLDANPLLRVKMLHEEPRRKILPLPLLQEMVDRCHVLGHHSEATLRLKHIILVALNTGMRKNEILRLTWEQVNLGTRYITLTETKSKKPRSIWMNGALLDLMQRLHGPYKSRRGPVFPGTKGQAQLDIKQAWGGLLRRLGIEGFRFHDLRRCWSTYAKGEMVARQQGLGHSSLAMTAAYTVPLEDDLRKMYESFQVRESAIITDKVIYKNQA